MGVASTGEMRHAPSAGPKRRRQRLVGIAVGWKLSPVRASGHRPACRHAGMPVQPPALRPTCSNSSATRAVVPASALTRGYSMIRSPMAAGWEVADRCAPGLRAGGKGWKGAALAASAAGAALDSRGPAAAALQLGAGVWAIHVPWHVEKGVQTQISRSPAAPCSLTASTVLQQAHAA